VVISVKEAHAHNGVLFDYLTSNVALEKPEMGSTDLNIAIDNNYPDASRQLGMPAGGGEHTDEAD
jgi:hypothetical protein